MNTEKTFTVVTANGKKTLTTTATTVGELKADLEKIGVNTYGMAIQEGLTKTTFGSDAQLLPHDIPYKGTTTSNLVIRVTQAEKHIKSGSMTREEAYKIIKENNLQSVISQRLGRNFTTCKTADLVNFIEAYLNKTTKTTKTTKTCQKPATEMIPTDTEEFSLLYSRVNNVKDALETLVDILIDEEGLISKYHANKVREVLYSTLEHNTESEYSDAEIDDMFDDWD